MSVSTFLPVAVAGPSTRGSIKQYNYVRLSFLKKDCSCMDLLSPAPKEYFYLDEMSFHALQGPRSVFRPKFSRKHTQRAWWLPVPGVCGSCVAAEGSTALRSRAAGLKHVTTCAACLPRHLPWRPSTRPDPSRDTPSRASLKKGDVQGDISTTPCGGIVSFLYPQLLRDTHVLMPLKTGGKQGLDSPLGH